MGEIELVSLVFTVNNFNLKSEGGVYKVVLFLLLWLDFCEHLCPALRDCVRRSNWMTDHTTN
jgi:hypothetical protein